MTRPVPIFVSGASLPGSLKQGARDCHLDGPSGKPADMGTFRGLRISLLLEFPPACSRLRSHHRLGEGVLAFTKITFGTAPTTAQGAQIGRVSDALFRAQTTKCLLIASNRNGSSGSAVRRRLRIGQLDGSDVHRVPQNAPPTTSLTLSPTAGSGIDIWYRAGPSANSSKRSRSRYVPVGRSFHGRL
jgi:hypothetical protein